MPLINCEINLILDQSANCVISEGYTVTIFAIKDAKRYAPVRALSTQGNAKLLEQLKSGFKRTINQNKHQ